MSRPFRAWLITFTVLGVMVIAADAAVGQTEPFTVEPLDDYGSPCDSTVEPWDTFCDLAIQPHQTNMADCSGISDTLNPPEPGSGSAVVRVVVAGEPAEPGDYTRSGCEIWLRPDRIHQRLGTDSIGVRVDWPTNGSLAFTIRAKLEGRDPDPANGDPNYIAPQPADVGAIEFDGTPIPADKLDAACDQWTSPSGWVYVAYWVPVLEIDAADDEDGDGGYRPVPGQGWVSHDWSTDPPTPLPAVTIYACSF